ncbi:MAG: NAD(P)-dependent oxidoreductase [Alphaproteobacteria bacterium]|nr:NAD(P)-dependent oxidoreductase [Alphaproteobacteria bacterium]
MTQRVGIVGMGLMGQAFIQNMRKSQFMVQGFDLDPRRVDQLRELGGHPVDTPADAAKDVDCVIVSVPTSDISREVNLGANGIAEGAAEGLYVCDTTTARPEDSETLFADLAERGIRYMDSCVSGTSTMAEAGDLVVIAGGNEEDFEACKPYFEGFSRAAYFMGPAGSGARTKLVINLILAGNRLALAEGMVLGEKAGLEANNLLKVLQDGACSSKTMIDKGPKMINADYSKQGQIKISIKDSRLMLEQGQRLGSPMLLTSVMQQVFQAAYEKGYGEKDTVSFFEILRGMAGLEEREGIDDVPFGKPE